MPRRRTLSQHAYPGTPAARLCRNQTILGIGVVRDVVRFT